MKPQLDRITSALFATMEYDGAPKELPPALERKRAAQPTPHEPMHCIRCQIDARSYHVYYGLQVFCLTCFLDELDR